MDELGTRARSSFWLALAGACTFCAPLGVYALVKALGVKRDANQRTERVPRFVYVAIVLAALSCVEFTAMLLLGYAAQHQKTMTLEAVQARLKGKREAAVLAPSVACDLAIEYLLKSDFHYDSASCPGPMTPAGDSEILAGVVAKVGSEETKVDACLVHGARWFVLHSDPGVECPNKLPGPVAASDEDEARARTAFHQARQDAALAAVTSQLAAIRTVVAHDVHAGKACPPSITSAPPGERHEIPFVDFDLLNAAPGAEDHGWDFLTKAAVRDALDARKEDGGRSVVDVLKADELVVFYSETRAWFQTHKKAGVFSDDFSFVPGAFEGWLLIVDPKAAQVMCEAPLAFSNGSQIRYLNGGPTDQSTHVNELLRDDLKDHFEDAATSTIDKLTASHLRLGLKILE